MADNQFYVLVEGTEVWYPNHISIEEPDGWPDQRGECITVPQELADRFRKAQEAFWAAEMELDVIKREFVQIAYPKE